MFFVILISLGLNEVLSSQQHIMYKNFGGTLLFSPNYFHQQCPNLLFFLNANMSGIKRQTYNFADSLCLSHEPFLKSHLQSSQV